MTGRTLTALLALLPLLATFRSAQAQTCTAEVQVCAELRRLQARADVRAAFDLIAARRPHARAELVHLTEIAAPPFGESERARAFAELLRGAGADSVWTDSIGNVIALRRGGGPPHAGTVAVAGHMDTVFPEGTDVTVHERGDTLYAPGIGDNTRGLVLLLELLRALQHAGIRASADLLIIGSVGEEGLGDLRGVKYLFREGAPRIDSFIAVDGASPNAIAHQALGSRRYRLTFHGPGGHSWGAFGTPNPVHALARAMTRFSDAAARLTRQGARSAYTFARIGGGTSINAIPTEAWAEVDLRSESEPRLALLDSLLHAAARRALRQENGGGRAVLTLDLQRVGDRPSGELPVATPLVQRAIAATQLLGGTPVLGRSSTDANVPIALGIPAITIGRGGTSGNVHAPDEWWLEGDAHVAVQRALLLVLAEAGIT